MQPGLITHPFLFALVLSLSTVKIKYISFSIKVAKYFWQINFDGRKKCYFGSKLSYSVHNQLAPLCCGLSRARTSWQGVCGGVNSPTSWQPGSRREGSGVPIPIAMVHVQRPSLLLLGPLTKGPTISQRSLRLTKTLTHDLWRIFRISVKLGVTMNRHNPTHVIPHTQEAEAGGSEVKSPLELYKTLRSAWTP